MAWWRAGARALAWGVSGLALLAGAARAEPVQTLDEVTVLATRTEEKTVDALAAVSTIGRADLDVLMASRSADVFKLVPGVSFTDRGDDPGTSINIRGLQDFGRVAVVVDGARQNFQRSGHGSDGQFYFDPEMLAEAGVVRGPVANIYGSGAIGGVVSLRTKDVDDVLRPGERWGGEAHGEFGSNRARGLGSVFGAVRPNAAIDAIAGISFRQQSDYQHGDGAEVANSANQVGSGLAKLTVRPADGHEIKFTGLTNRTDYDTGQKSVPNTSTYDTKVVTDTVTGRWRYARPSDRLFDVDGTVYWTRTDFEQTKITGSNNAITGRLGSTRSFVLDTAGFDAHNTSRFDTGALRHALTFGGDYFEDRVETSDPTGASDLSTPTGERSVYGGFAQWRLNYSTWFEFIGAARWDAYEMSDGKTASSGERLSPKATLGITPLPWITVYGTYAEGYRAPALTETLVAGPHPGPFTGAPNLFTFVPNPNLRPEVGKTKEIGVNLRKDGLFVAGDALRAKANWFRNDVEDYIEQVSYGPPVTFCPAPVPGCPPVPLATLNSYSLVQYRNTPQARLEGFEFEGRYDAGGWYAGLVANKIQGHDLVSGDPLISVPADKIIALFGIRLFERKVTIQASWTSAYYDDVPVGYRVERGYNLLDAYVGFQPSPDVVFSLSATNLLDEFYLPYPVAQPDMVLATAAPGRVFKGALKIRFGG